MPAVAGIQIRSTLIVQQEKMNMRMLMMVTFPVQPFNTYVQNGTLIPQVTQALQAMAATNVYFTEINGRRAMIAEINLKENSDLARVCAPWYLAFQAQVEVVPVMTPQELAKVDLQSLAQQWT
jgi:hypothetical protein